MVWQKFLLITAFVAGMLVGSASPAFAGDSTCTNFQQNTGQCSIEGNINGGGVTLAGHNHHHGYGGHNSGHNSGGNGGNGGGSKTPAPPCNFANCVRFGVILPGKPGNPGVTINDIKDFPARPGTDHMEPNGWMVVGLDTNFYSVVGVEIVKGTLLGQPASVRFTPIGWHWTYGDGSRADRATPGHTWAAQGIPEFDRTPTSHIYRAAGTYYIDLSITFRAEYRYAGGQWTPVYGTITLPANRLKATAGDAKTVLVNHDCKENPSGPGC